jgi:AraC-like DNA-binding protein
MFDEVHRFGFTSGHDGSMTVTSLALASAKIAEVRSTGHDIALVQMPVFSVLLPVAGKVRVNSHGRSFEAGVGDTVLLRPGDRETQVRADQSGTFRACVAVCDATRLAAGSMAGGGVVRTDSLPELRALYGFVNYTLREAAQPDSPLLRTGPRHAAEALVGDLMRTLESFDTPVTSAEADRAAARRVRQAEEFMRANADDALSVDDIALAVGIGTRSLQAAFRTVYGLSPRELLAEIRLENARERLLEPQPGDTVTSITFSSGFTHPGRFAAAYRARFGEGPSDTLRRSCGL